MVITEISLEAYNNGSDTILTAALVSMKTRRERGLVPSPGSPPFTAFHTVSEMLGVSTESEGGERERRKKEA